MTKRYQTTIARLFALTIIAALLFRFWPWQPGGIERNLPLMVWTLLCGLQAILLYHTWPSIPRMKDPYQNLTFILAIPGCVFPIVAWIIIMPILILESRGIDLDWAVVLVIILVFAWLYSITGLFISFFIPAKRPRDSGFTILRIVAVINPIALLISVRT